MTDEIKKKLTWWKFINRDRVFPILFAIGFLGLSIVLYLHFFVEGFYYLDITDSIGFNSIWIGIVVFGYMMASVGYKIFYKEWKKYLNE